MLPQLAARRLALLGGAIFLGLCAKEMNDDHQETLQEILKELSEDEIKQADKRGREIFTECLSKTDNNCPLSGACRLTSILCEALEGFYARLDQVSLADLTNGNGALTSLLRVA